MIKFNEDDQLEADIARMTAKRINAMSLVDEWFQWQNSPKNDNYRIIYIGLVRDAMRGTETEVDNLIVKLTEMNQESLLEKLSNE